MDEIKAMREHGKHTMRWLNAAGGVLRTSTPPTLNLLLFRILRRGSLRKNTRPTLNPLLLLLGGY
jgi:hypothetical protein